MKIGEFFSGAVQVKVIHFNITKFGKLIQITVSLVTHKLKDIYNAARNSSNTPYSSSYNCNHWCASLAKKLGYSTNPHWNCSCVM